MRTTLVLTLCLTLCLPARAEEAPLELSEVLAASATHFPLIIQSLAARRAAEGRALEAEGSFDVVFGADGFSRASGFYDGIVVNGSAKQRIRNLGADIYAGYSISDGDFPIYEDVNFTNRGGAAKVGVMTGSVLSALVGMGFVIWLQRPSRLTSADASDDSGKA